MAKLTFTFDKPDGTAMSRSATVSDADIADVIAWAMAKLSMPNDDKGNPVSERTPEWAVSRWAEIVVLDALAAAAQHKQEQLAKAAEVKPAAVSFS